MSVTQMPEPSLRWERVEATRLAWALVLSLMLHLVVFGSYEAGKKYGWWQALHWPAWVQKARSAKLLTQLFKKMQPPPVQPPQQEIPLVFVEVSPAQASPEPPKQAKYYSSRNALAANPQPDKQPDTPKIDGKQQEIVKTEDVPRNNFVPLQPSPPPLPQSKEPQEETKALKTEAPGDLTLAKPSPEPKPDDGHEQRHKFKTVAEAKAQQIQQNRLIGQKMRQEGGVERRRVVPSWDTKATPFGLYDERLVLLIQNAWYGLLDEQRYAADYRGKVVIRFQLHYDGRITDLDIGGNSAGPIPGLLCEQAIEKPEPYEKFPAEMRRVVGDVRHIQFTFYYD
jgi:hypothetical protein